MLSTVLQAQLLRTLNHWKNKNIRRGCFKITFIVEIETRSN